MKEAILKEAQTQLKAGGYKNLSFTQISVDLSTSRANMHHHFKNKEGLALEATKEFIDEHEKLIKDLAAQHKGNYPAFITNLEKLFFSILDEAGNGGHCICSQLIREHEIPQSLKRLSQDHFKKQIDFFKEEITHSKKLGTLKSHVKPQKLATQTHAIILGLALMAQTSDDLEQFKKDTKGTLVNWIGGFKN